MQPSDVTATVGQNATFTVTATGTAPLSYQWRKNGSNVGFYGPSATVTNLLTTDAGKYDVVVSNAAGSMTSGAATLTVVPVAPPRATHAPLVRVAYLIPSNRVAQADGVDLIKNAILRVHSYYAEQMQKHGFGNVSFKYETEADGASPLVKVVNLPRTDTFLRGRNAQEGYFLVKDCG